MIEKDDLNLLDNLKRRQRRNRRSFKAEINKKFLSDDDLDDLFLSD
jgi:hypothetical protein